MQSQHNASPYSYLLSLEEAVRRCAQGLPYHQIPQEDWIGVAFLSGDHVLLTPLNEVIEILPVQHLAPIPGVKPWLRGMATSHGELFPVTDLTGFLTQKISPITYESRILVIHFQEEYSGMLVDRVLGLQRMPKENRTTKVIEQIPEYEPFIFASFVNEHLQLPIISCQTIIQHPRFRDVALREDEMTETEE